MTLRTALASAGLLLLLAGCADDPAPVADDPAAGKPDRQEQRDAGQDDPANTPKTPASTAGGASRTSAVYYVGDTERAGPRLFREFRAGEGEALPAALELLSQDPLDPDYRTLWGADQLIGGSAAGDVVSVEVSPSVSERPAGMSGAEARAAVQQVVYTVQAALQQRSPVQFRTSDGPIDQVLGVPTSEPVGNGSMLQVLSHASLTSPEQGATVRGDTLSVSGVGNSFEANLGWEIRQGDRVVTDGYTTVSGWMGDKLFPFDIDVDVSGLEPGDYTIRVTTDDPTGGAEGVGAMSDDKEFTRG